MKSFFLVKKKSFFPNQSMVFHRQTPLNANHLVIIDDCLFCLKSGSYKDNSGVEFSLGIQPKLLLVVTDVVSIGFKVLTH